MLTVLSLALAAGLAKDDFQPPVRMKAGDEYVKVEFPGYAAPCWTDVNRDGIGDLVVGQFAQGKIKVHLGAESGLAEGQWLKAGGKVAEVPGVW
jgi:hypothetical protein